MAEAKSNDAKDGKNVKDETNERCAKCGIKWVGALQKGSSRYEYEGKWYHEHCLPAQSKQLKCQNCGYTAKGFSEDKCPKCKQSIQQNPNKQKQKKSKGNCHRCKMHIFEKCGQVENMKFHPKCFKCAKCDTDLQGKEFEIETVDNKEDIVCGNCN